MPPSDRWLAAGGAYESRVIAVPATVPRSEAQHRIADQAEYGRWELAKSTMYWGGARRMVLRRKAIKVASTLDADF
ncbi:MAG: DUF5703 family protein [Bifidobacteriaceae bacterium]|nr:DUF5703 family protein [Bifidobacteriaceae bacterium]